MKRIVLISLKYFLLITSILVLVIMYCRTPNDPTPGQIIKHASLNDGHKICLIGDSGKGNQQQLIVAKALFDENCSEIRVLGDVIYPDGILTADDPLFMEKFYNPYKALIEEAGVPFYMVMGNHDYSEVPADAWLEIHKRYNKINFPSMYYIDIYDNICMVTLDTNWLFFKQYFWMRTFRQGYKEQCQLTLSFGHHPRWSVGRHGDADFHIAKFLDTTVIGKVDAYFAGHDHNLSDEGEKNGTHLFVSGAAGTGKPLGDENQRVWAYSGLGYQVLTIRNKSKKPSFEFEFVEVELDGTTRRTHSGKRIGRGIR